jgi:hypothetical protein
LLLLWVLLASAACGSDDVDRGLGARCGANSDCDVKCLPPGSEYPGGMCTSVCLSDAECRSDATCVEREGGVCLFRCRDDGDCDFLGELNGQRWTCQPDESIADATVMVCLGTAQ